MIPFAETRLSHWHFLHIKQNLYVPFAIYIGLFTLK